MRLTIVAVGKLTKSAEHHLVDRYLSRMDQLGPSLGLKPGIREVADGRAARASDRMTEEAAAIMSVLPQGAALCVLDQRGKHLDSEAFAVRIEKWRDQAVPDLVLIIGGADGLDPALRGRADLVLSFGAMTWPHQLVRGMLAEQLYRAMTILARHPYHRR